MENANNPEVLAVVSLSVQLSFGYERLTYQDRVQNLLIHRPSRSP